MFLRNYPGTGFQNSLSTSGTLIATNSPKHGSKRNRSHLSFLWQDIDLSLVSPLPGKIYKGKIRGMERKIQRKIKIAQKLKP